MTRHVFDLLAEIVFAEGTRACFALLGDANMSFATRLEGLGTRFVHVRHEHCAVAAASAYARATGAVGVATVTCGPGLTQILTALPAAVRAGIPLVVIAGESPQRAAWYNQAIDQAPFVVATGASYRPLHDARRIAAGLRDAFLEARTEKKPVVVGVPFDLQADPAPAGDLPEPSASLLPRYGPIPPNEADIARAADRAAAAERVIVMAGRGAVLAGAGPACQALAARLGALTATTLPARGLFADDPFCLGIAGGFATAVGRRCFEAADLVIAVGGRLAQHNTDKGRLIRAADVIHIDEAPRGMSQGEVVARHHVRADARLGVEALNAALGGERVQGWRTNAIARAIADTPADPAEFPPPAPGLFDPREVVSALDAALPLDWEMVNSSGHCSFYFAQMPRRPNATFHTIREFGAIGNGTSYAMGVAAARPGNRVVLFDGDGSVMMHVQEIDTMLRSGMDILICVLNDGAFGSEIHKLRADGLSDAGAIHGRIDLAAVARGFGARGHRIDDLAALPALAAAYGRTGGVEVWDLSISDRIASPVIRRAHPGGHDGVERPVAIEGLA